MNKFNQLISDGDGQPSLMRVAVLIVVGSIMFVWAYLSIKAGVMIPLPWAQMATIGAALGWKTLQSFAENLEDCPTAESAKIPENSSRALVVETKPVTPQSGFVHLKFLSVLAGIFAIGALTMFILAGCSSPKPIDTQPPAVTRQVDWDIVANTISTLAAGASVAAEMYDPNSVEYLRAADMALTVALADKAFDPDQLKVTLSTISINELHESAAQTAILAAVAIYKVNWQKAVAAKIDTSPVAVKLLTALRDGIESGIGCVPVARNPPAPIIEQISMP